MDEKPRYLLRDRDAIYRRQFCEWAQALGIKDALTAYRSPWQNPSQNASSVPYGGNGLDHVIVAGSRHLKRVPTLWDAPRLFRHRVGDFFVALADIDAPQATDAIDIAFPIRVIDMRAFGFSNNQRSSLLEGCATGPRMNIVTAIFVSEIIRIVK